MSGETEASVSGWTTDTLHQHLTQRISDLDRTLSRRMDDSDKAIQAALAAAEKAVVKAETANEKRFEGVNEFRKALSDQTSTFIPRLEYDTAHDALAQRVASSSDRVAALELRLTSRLDLGQGTATGASVQRTERRLDYGTVLAAVAILVSLATVLVVAFKK